MNQAVRLGKKVEVAIMAGSSIPAWVFVPQTSGGAGVAPLNFTVSPHSGSTTNCIATTNAAPWDTNYLAVWSLMLNQLSSHLKIAGTYSNVTLLRITGSTAPRMNCACQPKPRRALVWIASATLRPSGRRQVTRPINFFFAWSNLLSSFQTNFPDKLFSVAIIPDNPFPPIDNTTNIFSGSKTDENSPLLALVGQELPGRLVVQFNFLMTGTNANPAVSAAAQAYGTLTTYQSNNYYGACVKTI